MVEKCCNLDVVVYAALLIRYLESNYMGSREHAASGKED